MAVVATFRADFSDFMKKAQAAQGSLDAMASAAGVTAGTVARVGNSFSGERIIREASAAALAVQEIGGASRLTEAEMARVNRTTAEAIAKLKALGLEVPPQIARLHAETQRAATSTGALAEKTSLASKVTSGFTGAIAQMAAAFSVSALIDRTVGAIAEFGSAAIQSAGVLTDLRNKTGLSLSLLQEMQVVAEQTGTSIDVLTHASYQLSLRLASNTDVLTELGLAYAELRNLSPDEQFKRVFRALEGVDDIQDRARIGAELYGAKVYKEIAPAVTEGWDNIAGAIKKSNDAQLEAIDRAADRYTQFKRDVTTAFTGVIGNFFLARDELKHLDEGQQQHFAMLQKFGGDAQGYLVQLAQQRIAAEKTVQPVEEKRTEIVRDYVRELAAQQEKLKALTPTTIAQIDAARALGASEEDLIRQFGVSATTLKLLAEQKKETAKAAKDYEDKVKKTREEQEKFQKSVKSLAGNFVELRAGIEDSGEAIRNAAQGFNTDGTLITQTLDETAKAQAAARKETEEWARATGAVLMPTIEAATTAIEEGETATVDWRGSVERIIGALTQMAQTIGPLRGLAAAFGEMLTRVRLTDQATREFREGMAALKKGGDQTHAGMLQLATSAGALAVSFLQAVSTGDTFTRTLAGIQMGLQIGAMFGPLGTAIGAAAGGLIGLVSGLRTVSAETRQVQSDIAAFQRQLSANLTTTQAAEAAGRSWAATTIAVRDAYLATGRSAAEAEAIVRQLWNDRNPNAARAAIEQINQVMAEAQQRAQELQDGLRGAFGEAIDAGIRIPDSMQNAIQSLIDMGRITGDNVDLFAQLSGNNQSQFKAMEDAAKKYGVELSALGPAFAQNRLDQQATSIIDAFGAMTRGGADTQGVIAGMSDEINAFVQEAIKSGRTVPENMRPILNAMIAQGELTDKNGKKLEDLSSINFGPPVESAFDRIIGKLQELIDRLTDPEGFEAMADNAKQAARDVGASFDHEITPAIVRTEDALDGFLFGHSPGGLKEIPILARAAGDAISGFAGTTVESMRTAEGSLNGLLSGIRTMGSAGLTRIRVDRDADEATQAIQKEFEGFIDPNLGVITEAAALERITKVAALYGQQIDAGIARTILTAYGYKGGGRVLKGRLDEYLQDVVQKFVEQQTVGFARGTKATAGSWFRNFGAGTAAMLHGDEAVVPRGQAAAFAEATGVGGMSDAVAAEVAGLRSDFAALPRMIARAVRDVVLVGA